MEVGETVIRVVIDSNSLRTDELRAFLAARPGNRAVLIDYASIEAYKTNPLLPLTPARPHS